VETARRYFVTVRAPSHRSLLALEEYSLDLFHPTAAKTREDEYTIEGLMTLDDVGRLVDDGYQVLVQDEMSKRARARQTIDFDEWLKGMES
jgi:hypothetical protein